MIRERSSVALAITHVQNKCLFGRRFILALAGMLIGLIGSPALLYAEAPLEVSKALTELFEKPSDAIDVGDAALLVETLRFQDQDIAAASHRIDALAQQVKSHLKNKADFTAQLKAINLVIYKVNGFHYDISFEKGAVAHAPDESDYFLSRLLMTKSGYCESLALLYLAVAQRVGIKAYPVAAPGHLFVRAISAAGDSQDIDTTGGYFVNDAYYVSRFNVPQRGIDSGAYLRTQNLHELLGELVLLAVTAPGWPKDDMHEAEKRFYLEKAASLSPRNLEIFEALRQARQTASNAAQKRGDMASARRFQMDAASAQATAKDLGYQDQPTSPHGCR